MTEPVPDLFNPADFASVEVVVIFRNQTSHAEALPPEAVSLLEIEEDGVVLELPSTSCAAQHSVALEIHREDPAAKSEAIHLPVTGKIASVEKTDDKTRVRVKVTFLQYDEATWSLLNYQVAKRQEAVMQFINSARG